MIDEATVRGWLREVAERIQINEDEVSRLRSEIVQDLRKKQALEELLVPKSSGSSNREAQASGHPIERAAVAILEGNGKPLHVSDIRLALEQKGIPIPGKGTDANVIVYLSRSHEVCRVGKGLYALRAWGVPEVPPRQRRSKHRGRNRTRRGSRDARRNPKDLDKE